MFLRNVTFCKRTCLYCQGADSGRARCRHKSPEIVPRLPNPEGQGRTQTGWVSVTSWAWNQINCELWIYLCVLCLGTDANLKAFEYLQKAWAVLEPKSEEIGLHLFRYEKRKNSTKSSFSLELRQLFMLRVCVFCRTMFKSDPDLMPLFPFYKDEWNKISYQDYQGSHPEQPPNTWFIVFRCAPVNTSLIHTPRLQWGLMHCWSSFQWHLLRARGVSLCASVVLCNSHLHAACCEQWHRRGNVTSFPEGGALRLH